VPDRRGKSTFDGSYLPMLGAWMPPLVTPAIVQAGTDAGPADRPALSAGSTSSNDVVSVGLEALSRRGEGAAIPLTPSQEDLLATVNMFRGFYAGGGWHNLWISLLVRGPLDLAILRSSIADIVRRHEILRTTFPVVDGVSSVKIWPSADAPIAEIDLTSLSATEHPAEVARIVADGGAMPQNLHQGPLLQFKILKLDGRMNVVVAIVDHMLFDGWSFGVFIRELNAIYHARIHGRPSDLPELPIQYGDYAIWEKQRLTDRSVDAARAYWHAELARPLATALLPTDRKRALLQRFSLGRTHFRLSTTLSERAAEFSRRNNISLFATLLATFKALLWKYTGEDDVSVASATVNRPRPEFRGLIGLFSNIVILRNDLQDNPSFVALARRVCQTIAGALAHQDYPFSQLRRELFPRSVPFRTFFTLQNYPSPALDLHPAHVTPLDINYGSGLWELNVILATSTAGISGTACYNAELFHEASIARILRDYKFLLGNALTEPMLRTAELSLTRHQ
jgi:hypothetical protein